MIDGKKVKMKLSTEAIRTLKKKGLLGNGTTKQTATLTK